LANRVLVIYQYKWFICHHEVIFGNSKSKYIEWVLEMSGLFLLANALELSRRRASTMSHN
jgi:hypothetical protein